MTQVIGHRGASRAERENTLAAFRAAVAQGADGVELDVRRTADGALAVHHDAHLPDGRAIVATTWADMPDHVPDLASALDACAGLRTVNVEIKNWPGDVDFDPSLAVVDRVRRGARSDGPLPSVPRCSCRASTCRRSIACAPRRPSSPPGGS